MLLEKPDCAYTELVRVPKVTAFPAEAKVTYCMPPAVPSPPAHIARVLEEKEASL
jgi:hypothetical protein